MGYVLGLAPMQIPSVRAQAQAAPAAPRAVDGKGLYFSSEQIKKMFPPADKTGNLPPSTISNHLAWDPFYRFTVMRRPILIHLGSTKVRVR